MQALAGRRPVRRQPGWSSSPGAPSPPATATAVDRPGRRRGLGPGPLRPGREPGPVRRWSTSTRSRSASLAAAGGAVGSGEPQLARPRRRGCAPPGWPGWPRAAATRDAAVWDPDGTVLVTGGTGALGAAGRPAPGHRARRPPPAAGQPPRPRRPRRGRAARRADRARRRRHRGRPATWPTGTRWPPCSATVPGAAPADRRGARRRRARRRGARLADPASGSTRCCAPKVDAALHLHELTRDAT